MTELHHEIWLAERLKQHGADPVIHGDLGELVRRDRIRMVILEHGLEAVIAGSRSSKPETYAQVFERLYGEPLTGRARKSRQATPSESHA